MKDFLKELPGHQCLWTGEQDLYLELYKGWRKVPLVFIHGAYTGSWMWCKYIPHFAEAGYTCYVMNLRGHYMSRSVDMTQVAFDNYLEDIQEIVGLCETAPVLVGFSMGGILSQKAAETLPLSGLVLVDSSICKEVHERVPYKEHLEVQPLNVIPAPERSLLSIDESKEDVLFQIKYLSEESALAFSQCGNWMKGVPGISIDRTRIHCPVLSIKVIQDGEDERRGQEEADYYGGTSVTFNGMTHTGILMGKRYREGADTILKWLNSVLQ